MGDEVRGLHQIDRTQIAAGGKGANLGELTRIEGIDVPPGLCVTADAYRRVVAAQPEVTASIDRLAGLSVDERDAIHDASAAVRRAIEAVVIPADLAAAIRDALGGFGPDTAFAVRSSATAEDLPTASFAGQHDSYLGVVGERSILERVVRCWASLFTERAVTYRIRNGIDHRQVEMGVVVQRMVDARVSGVLFTADPVSGNRRVATVDAVPGLGEALVSGTVTPDAFRVRDAEIVERIVQHKVPTLTDAQVVELVRLGRRIEAHLGRPQDVEWCWDGRGFEIVQSRPITTLFPIPERDDDANHVYVSVGHQQMMTEPMKPLGLSVWQLTAIPTMYEAAGRLFVDVTAALATPATRPAMVGGLGRSDPLLGHALQIVVDRGDFLPPPPEAAEGAPAGPPPGAASPAPIGSDPAIVDGLVERSRAEIAALRTDIATKMGEELLDLVLDEIRRLKRFLTEPLSRRAIMAGMEATWWLNDHVQEWLGVKNAADTLTRSLPDNVTSRMGLALLDVADAVRPHPEVVAFLEEVTDDGFVDDLPAVPGGEEALRAIEGFLDRYGMRCVGEIDITRPRWAEHPSALVPLILGNVRNFEAGAGRRRFDQGLREAQEKQAEILERLRALPAGAEKASETERMIERVRTFGGYREYPKYDIVSRLFAVKQALMAEARRQVAAGRLRDAEDVHWLTFDEVRDVVCGTVADRELIAQRRAAFRRYEALIPPRVLTSEGEAVAGAYRRDDLPAGALVGLAVSSGTIEGRARVIHDLGEANLEPGDILVTAATDPSWSPLFVAVAGLVTEVGGLMTHGAVIAREYGLPAVVGVQGATQLIADGQRIRVHGTEGYVEVLA